MSSTAVISVELYPPLRLVARYQLPQKDLYLKLPTADHLHQCMTDCDYAARLVQGIENQRPRVLAEPIVEARRNALTWQSVTQLCVLKRKVHLVSSNIISSLSMGHSDGFFFRSKRLNLCNVFRMTMACAPLRALRPRKLARSPEVLAKAKLLPSDKLIVRELIILPLAYSSKLVKMTSGVSLGVRVGKFAGRI